VWHCQRRVQSPIFTTFSVYRDHTTNTMLKPETQYIYLVRYGLTDPPLMENVGNYDSDIHPADGVEHAQAIANVLRDQQPKEEENVTPWRWRMMVYSDPFIRCAHTANIIANVLDCPHRIEVGLTE